MIVFLLFVFFVVVFLSSLRRYQTPLALFARASGPYDAIPVRRALFATLSSLSKVNLIVVLLLY